MRDGIFIMRMVSERAIQVQKKCLLHKLIEYSLYLFDRVNMKDLETLGIDEKDIR